MPNARECDDIRVSFVGGCHVDGSYVGSENSFSKATSDHLSAQHLPHVFDVHAVYRFRRAFDLKALLGEPLPDVLVIQLGTFESGPTLIKGRFHLTKKRKKKIAAAEWQPPHPANATFVLTSRLRLKFALKSLAHRLMRYRALDLKRIDAEISQFMERLAGLHVPYVIVLAPLPSFDPPFAIYRGIVRGLIERHARQIGLDLMDVNNLLIPENYLPDGVHLNRDGNQMLGRVVGERIIRMMASARRRTSHAA